MSEKKIKVVHFVEAVRLHNSIVTTKFTSGENGVELSDEPRGILVKTAKQEILVPIQNIRQVEYDVVQGSSAKGAPEKKNNKGAVQGKV